MDNVLVGFIIVGNLFFILRNSYKSKKESERGYNYIVSLSRKLCITMCLVLPALFIIDQYNDVGTVLTNELEELRAKQDELLAYGEDADLKVTVEDGEIQYNVDTKYNYMEASKKLSTVSERIVAIDEALSENSLNYVNPAIKLLFTSLGISYIIDLVFYVLIGKTVNFNLFRSYKFKITGIEKELGVKK